MTCKGFNAFEVEELHGMFWPQFVLQLNRPEEYKKIKKDEWTQIVHKNAPVKGVMKGPDFGWAPGVLRVSSKSGNKVSISDVLASSSDSLREGECKDIFAAASRQASVETVPLKKDSPFEADSTIKLKGKVRLEVDPGDSDDEDSTFTRKFTAKLAGACGAAKEPAVAKAEKPKSGRRYAKP